MINELMFLILGIGFGFCWASYYWAKRLQKLKQELKNAKQ